MDEIEKRMQSMRLAQPSAELDARIEETLASALAPEQVGWLPRIWWWLTPAAATASLAVLVLVSLNRSRPAINPIVHHVEAAGQMREMLLNVAIDPNGTPPAFSVGDHSP